VNASEPKMSRIETHLQSSTDLDSTTDCPSWRHYQAMYY